MVFFLMATPCVTSLDLTSGPFFGVKMKARDLHHYSKELLAPRDARDDFHFLEGTHKLVGLRSISTQISNSQSQIGSSGGKVDHDSQFFDHGFQIWAIEQADGFPFTSSFSDTIWPCGSPLGLLLTSSSQICDLEPKGLNWFLNLSNKISETKAETVYLYKDSESKAETIPIYLFKDSDSNIETAETVPAYLSQGSVNSLCGGPPTFAAQYLPAESDQVSVRVPRASGSAFSHGGATVAGERDASSARAVLSTPIVVLPWEPRAAIPHIAATRATDVHGSLGEIRVADVHGDNDNFIVVTTRATDVHFAIIIIIHLLGLAPAGYLAAPENGP
jgi:hypothetical protein